MQSGALAIPSAECLLLDELSKPQRLKEINWNPPPSSIFSLCPFKEWPTAWDGGTLMCEIDSSWGCWSLAVSFWYLRLNPPLDSRRREGEDKAFSFGTEGEGRGRGRGRWVHWQQLRICGDLGDDFISNGWLSSKGSPTLRKKHSQLRSLFPLLMCCVCETDPLIQTMGLTPTDIYIHIHAHMHTQTRARIETLNLILTCEHTKSPRKQTY